MLILYFFSIAILREWACNLVEELFTMLESIIHLMFWLLELLIVLGGDDSALSPTRFEVSVLVLVDFVGSPLLALVALVGFEIGLDFILARGAALCLLKEVVFVGLHQILAEYVTKDTLFHFLSWHENGSCALLLARQ